MARGGFPGIPGGNMQQLMRQAQKMQQQMMKAQEDLDAREYEGTAGGGAVSCKVSGKRQLLSLTIDKDAVDPGRSRNASGHDCRGRQRRAQEG